MGALGASWGVLGAFSELFGASWVPLGASWGHLGDLLGSLLGLLGPLGGLLGPLGSPWVVLGSPGPVGATACGSKMTPKRHPKWSRKRIKIEDKKEDKKGSFSRSSWSGLGKKMNHSFV